MSSLITIPADVIPLLYSGLQLDIWQRVMPDLDELFLREGRAEHPEWFAEPFERLDRTRALLDVIDWPRSHQPIATSIELDAHREVMRSALEAELRAQRDLRDSNENVELLEESVWAVVLIEDFLLGVPEVEAETSELVNCLSYGGDA
jgi:hypothetical protein